MERSRNILRAYILRMVAAHDGNVALSQPRDHRNIESGHLSGPSPEPRALRIPLGPQAGAYEERVPGTHLHSGFLFPGLQVFDVNGSSRFEVRHAFETRDVDQDAAR